MKMRDQCVPIFRQARRDVQDAGLPVLAGCGPPETREPVARSRTRDRSVARSVPLSEESNDTTGNYFYKLNFLNVTRMYSEGVPG